MDVAVESEKTLKRLLENIELNGLSKADQKLFVARLKSNFPALFDLLHQVYGEHYDFFYYLFDGFVTRVPPTDIAFVSPFCSLFRYFSVGYVF